MLPSPLRAFPFLCRQPAGPQLLKLAPFPSTQALGHWKRGDLGPGRRLCEGRGRVCPLPAHTATPPPPRRGAGHTAHV